MLDAKAKLYDPAHHLGVPVALLSTDLADKIAMVNKWCATFKPDYATNLDQMVSQFPEWALSGPLAAYTRTDLSSDDKDPLYLIPEPVSLQRLFFDFMPELSMDGTNVGIGHSYAVLVVNKLSQPLTITYSEDNQFHGNLAAHPSLRTWDDRHEHYNWDHGKNGSWTIPAGSRATKTVGVGVLGAKWTNGFFGAAAGYQITSADPNLPDPIWFVCQDAYGHEGGRRYSVNLTNDVGAYRNLAHYYDSYADKNRTSHDSCELKKGEGQDTNANYTAEASIAMIDPAPPGSGEDVDAREYASIAQAVLVIDTEHAPQEDKS